MKAILRKRVTTYVLGFMLSLVLTLLAFGAVWAHELSGHQLPSHGLARLLLVIFALVQLWVQLALFLHVGEEEKPRWNLLVLLFAGIIVAILVGGSLWIMNHLSHQLMSAGEVMQGENVFLGGETRNEKHH